MRRFTTIALVLCLLLSGMALFSFSGNDNGLTTEEHNDDLSTKTILNVPASYPTIQAAITAASASGDTIQVSSGLYPENIVIPSGKSVDVIGAGSDTTIIWGGYSGSTVTINGDGCTIKGFKINASGLQPGDAGIYLNSDYNTIEECNISRNNLGICMNNSDYNTIRNNTVTGNHGVTPPPLEGLLGHWKMDETSWAGTVGEVKDSSGYGNDGTAKNGATTTIGRYGNSGTFDGSNDFVSIDPYVNNIEGLDAGTIIGWFKASTSESTGMIFTLSDKDSANVMQVGINNVASAYTDESFWYSIHQGTGVDPLTMHVRKGEKYYSDDKWHHFAIATGDGDNRIFIDGNKESLSFQYGSKTTNEFSNINNPDAMRIGMRECNSASLGYFDGQIDEIEVYDRALTDHEVQISYRNDITGGLRLWHSHNNIISNNSIYSNAGDGIQSFSSHDNDINNNTIEANYCSGTFFDSSLRNEIKDNSISSNYGCDPVTNGLVGYWKMDEEIWGGSTGEVKDSCGNGNDGTANGGASIANGKYGNAGDFDGSNDYVDLGDQDGIVGDTGFTITSWVYPKVISGDQREIISKADGINSVDTQYTFRLSTSGKLELIFSDGGVSGNILTSSSSVQTDKWTFVSGSWDGTTGANSMMVYVNGEIAGTRQSTVSTIQNLDSPNNALIGRWSSSLENYFDGLIDDLRIYNRSLSEQEVIQNYLSGIRSGITLRESDDNNIIGNTLDSNIGHGISLIASDDNDIRYNDILNNNGSGMCIEDSNNNDIINNTVASNEAVIPNLEVGLQAHWKLDEEDWNGTTDEVKDSSGNDYHGTSKNGADVTSDSRFGNAGDFDGNNDYVTVGNPSGLDFGAKSICVWFKSGAKTDSLISKGESRGWPDERDWDLYGDGTYLRFMMSTGSAGNGNAYGTYPSLNNWHFAVATWDGTTNTDSLKLYCDGVLLGKDTPTSTSYGTGEPIYIGGGETPDWHFDGELDEVRIYNRPLIAKEVNLLYLDGVEGGIYLKSSDNNIIKDNIIQNHTGYGIRTNKDCSSTTVTGNAILNNFPGFPQAQSDESSGSWDTGSTGNFWSDWQTPDNNPPFGIVDVPYNLQGMGSEQDRYPLCISIEPPANLTAYEEVYYTGTCKSVNIVGEPVWSFTSNATWFLFDTSNGTFNGTPTNDDVGIYWINVSMTVGLVGTFKKFNITVIDSNDPPQITTSPVTTATEDIHYEVTYSAVDMDKIVNVFTWGVTTNASFLSMDATSGVLNGTPLNADVGTFWVNVTVSDNRGGTDWQLFDLTVLNMNDPPLITSADDTDALEDELYSVDYDAIDIDPTGDILDWSVTGPSFLSINQATGVLSGTPLNADVGSHPVNVTVSDGLGGSDSTEFDLVVMNVNDHPVIITLDVTNATEEVLYEVDYNAIDVDPTADILTWSVTSEAVFLQMDSSTGVLSGTPVNAEVGDHWVNVSVSDGLGGSDYSNFTLTVEDANDPPFWLDLPMDVLLKYNEYYVFDVNASDIDPGDFLIYYIRSTPETDIGIDHSSGIIAWTPTTSGVFQVNLSAFDGDVYIYHEYQITVLPQPKVTLIAPGNGSESEILNPSFTWDAYDDAGYQLLYDLYLDEDEQKVQDLESTTKLKADIPYSYFNPEDPLEKGKTYYWTVIPHEGVSVGICDSGVFSFSITEDAIENNAPYFVSDPILGVEVDTKWTYDPIAADDDGETVTISYLEGPSGMVFDSGKLTWTPTSIHLGEHFVKIEASDGLSLVYQEFWINVSEDAPIIENEPPLVDDISSKTITEGEMFQVQVFASDPEGKGIQFEVFQGPDGMTIDEDGIITWQTKNGDAGTYNIILQVRDDGDGLTSTTFTLTVEESEDDTKDEGSLLWLGIILVVAILLIIIIVISVLIMRRKKEPLEPEDEDSEVLEPEQEAVVKSGWGEVVKEEKITKVTSRKPKGPAKPLEPVDTDAQIEADPEELPLLPGATIEDVEMDAEDLEGEMEPEIDIDSIPATPEDEIGGGLDEMPPDLDIGPQAAPPGMDATPGAIPPEMAQFMASEDDKNKEVYHEDSKGVWSPDMVEKRTAADAKNAVEMLKDLKELKDSGVITDEEFEVSKRRLLRKI